MVGHSAGGARQLSRRGLIGGLAGAGTVGIASVVRAAPASAQEPTYLAMEEENLAGGPTAIRSTTETFGELDDPAVFAAHLSGAGDLEGTYPVALGGSSDQTVGVYASTQSGSSALLAEADQGAAIIGRSRQSIGVAGTSEGDEAGLYGRSASGPQLLLEPHRGSVGPPTSASWMGSILCDGEGDLYVQTGITHDSWRRLVREDQLPSAGRVVPLASPVRVADLLVPAGAVRIVVVRPSTGVPAGAAAVTGSISAIAPGYRGHLALGPAGAARATAVSFAQGQPSTAGFTCTLAPRANGGAISVKATGTTSATVRVRIHVTAYITG
jgi:hypothetical protein